MHGKNGIKLIACDIDGTLVVNGKVVSPELRHIFAELRRQGVAATLCTGRMPHWTVAVADELGLTEYLICTEGGHVFYRPTGEDLHYAAIHRRVVESVARLTEGSPEVGLAAMCHDTIWATSRLAARRAHWWGSRSKVVHDVRDAPPPVLLVLFGPQEVLERGSRALRDELPAELAFIHDIENQGSYAHFKICAPETDKGVGAERLVRRLGGDRTQILAFGDYLNDLGIMRHAGHSICPRDAHPEIRRIATRVSPYSAEEGFVVREIKRTFGLP
jgi:hypothetical protein